METLDEKLKKREVACLREGNILTILYDNDELVVYGEEPADESEKAKKSMPNVSLNLRTFDYAYWDGKDSGCLHSIPFLSYEAVHPYNRLFGPHKPGLINDGVRILTKAGIKLPETPKGYPELKPLIDLVKEHIPLKKDYKFSLFHPGAAIGMAMFIAARNDVPFYYKLYFIPYYCLRALIPIGLVKEEGFSFEDSKTSDKMILENEIDNCKDYVALVRPYKYSSDKKYRESIDIDVFNMVEFENWKKMDKPEKIKPAFADKNSVFHISYGIEGRDGKPWLHFWACPFSISKIEEPFTKKDLFLKIEPSFVKELEKIASLPTATRDIKEAYKTAKQI